MNLTKEKELNEAIEDYCSLNEISDVDEFKYKCLLTGFNIERYGLSPGDNVKRQNGEIKPKETDTEVSGETKTEEPKIVRKKRKITVKNTD